MTSWLGASLKSLEELFFPPLCQVCGRLLCRNELHICIPCLTQIPLLPDESEGIMPVMLKEYEGPGQPEQLFALFYYDRYDAYKNLLYHIKYRSRRSLAFALGRLLGKKMKGRCHADCIVPIPLHPKRERARGFNQAREIARGVATELGIEVLDQVIARVCNTRSQTGKNINERRENVSGIFTLLRPEAIRDRHVLLLDDVVTSGATMESCLRTLAAAGNVRFSLACLAQH